tara:strand:- start:156 stop:1475 length:1320 start_codon:yes stop_codon:yes gene_type:complete
MKKETLEYIKEALNEDLGSKTSNYWLDQVEVLVLNEKEAVFSVPSLFIKDSFERKFGKKLKKELNKRGFSTNYEIKIDETLVKSARPNIIKKTETKKSGGDTREKRKTEDKVDLEPFNKLFIGSSNNLAVVAAKNIVQKPGERFNPLFLYGAPGVGKTNLLRTIEKTREDALYIDSESFLNLFVSAIKNNETAKFKDKIRNNSILLIDDIQFLAGKKAVSEELLHTVNHYIEGERSIVLVSDVKPGDLKGFPERLVSRVYNGLATDIDKPDKEVVEDFFRNTGIEKHLEEGLFDKICSFPFSNFREMNGLINTFAANKIASVDNKLFIKEYLKKGDVFSLRKETPEDLLSLVADSYQIDPLLIVSKNRTEKISNARHVLIALLRTHTDLSLNQIGLFVGNRSHSTILSSLNKIEKNEELKKGVKSFDNLRTKETKELVG